MPYDARKVRIDGKTHAAHVKALAAIRAKAVDAIDTADVLSVLKPLWLVAPETASRLRGRIEAVLAAATASWLLLFVSRTTARVCKTLSRRLRNYQKVNFYKTNIWF
jgi:hypothetical protein